MKLTRLQSRFILAAINTQLNTDSIWPLAEMDDDELDAIYFNSRENILAQLKSLQVSVKKNIPAEIRIYAVSTPADYKIVELKSDSHFSIEEGIETLKQQYPESIINFLKLK